MIFFPKTGSLQIYFILNIITKYKYVINSDVYKAKLSSITSYYSLINSVKYVLKREKSLEFESSFVFEVEKLKKEQGNKYTYFVNIETPSLSLPFQFENIDAFKRSDKRSFLLLISFLIIYDQKPVGLLIIDFINKNYTSVNKQDLEILNTNRTAICSKEKYLQDGRLLYILSCLNPVYKVEKTSFSFLEDKKELEKDIVINFLKNTSLRERFLTS